MLARTQIAVFDHNCSIEREQSTTKAGKLRYKMHYSKVTDQCVFKKIMEPKEKTYIKEIIDEIKYGDKRNWKYVETRKKTIAKINNPGKDVLLKNLKTRYDDK